MDDEQLRRTAWRSIAAFQRVIGTYATGARLSDTEHYVASAVPGLPSSLINSAVPIDDAPVAPYLDEIESFYADTPKWGAWLDPAATDDAHAVSARGLVLDSTPVMMVAELDDLVALSDAPPADRVEPGEVGAVNDLAYDIPEPVFARVTTPLASAEPRGYGARVDGEIASVLIIADAGGDAFVTLVATLPQHRGKQLASSLLTAALAEARQRGQTTTSLQASKARPEHLRPPRLPRARRGPSVREAAAVTLNPALEEAKYCPRCGQTATVDYPRSINCPHCGYGAYYNPKPVAAAIPVDPDGNIVLLKRGFDPGKDLWTFPGGFVDLGESVEDAAHREAQEELQIDIELTKLVGVYSRPEDRVVLIVFAATTMQTPQTTPEATEVTPFQPDEIPWQELAFWSTTQALKDFLAARS